VHEETHPAETRVVREGDYDDCMYLIVEGMVRITKGETILATLGPKDFFGEMAVFEGDTRSATGISETEVRLLRLDRDDLLYLMEELPTIAIRICQTLSRRVRNTTDRVRS
ncbi:MAG: cyclic nucleotide-binding domain-containing protein, partial [Planctomycetota bacterium]